MTFLEFLDSNISTIKDMYFATLGFLVFVIAVKWICDDCDKEKKDDKERSDKGH